MSKDIPAFGTTFYEEMPITYFDGEKWSATAWQPSDKLVLHPAAHCLHYGSEIFEGAKAFRHADDSIWAFRVDQHFKRMHHSSKLLYLPFPSEAQFTEMFLDLVKRSKDVVPDSRGALYVRPLLLGTDPLLGKAGHPSHRAMFYIMASPSGDYFKQGSELKILIETKHERCAPHMGVVKSGGNYASALHWTMVAEEKYGAQQVLFCPNGDVQETGASNFMLIDGKTIITKELTDQFLHGVTRLSLLQIARDNGYTVEERDFTVDEVLERVANGAEAALTGTAAVLSPVTSFVYNDKEYKVSSHEEGLKLRGMLTDIQYGRTPDPYGWLTKVC